MAEAVGPFRAGDRDRTGDLNLGKVALCQLSYARRPDLESYLQRQKRSRLPLRLPRSKSYRLCADCQRRETRPGPSASQALHGMRSRRTAAGLSSANRK